MESIDKYYRVYASVNLDNIYANMKELKDNTANGTQMVAVIKTDGYGHGAAGLHPDAGWTHDPGGHDNGHPHRV